jgi:hypothetical protein
VFTSCTTTAPTITSVRPMTLTSALPSIGTDRRR